MIKKKDKIFLGIFLFLFLIMFIIFVTGSEEQKEITIKTYTSTTDKICVGGTCTLTLYSGVRNVYEDDEWKRVEDARSLKDKGFDVVYLENDKDFELIVEDFNMTFINLSMDFKGNPEDYPDFCAVAKDGIQANCDFKLDEKWDEFNETTGEFIEKSQLKFQYKWERDKTGIVTKGDKFKYEYKGNPFERKFKFGGNSTTIILQDADTENLKDSMVWKNNPDSNYGTDNIYSYYTGGNPIMVSYITFNISSIPEGATIENSLLHLYYSGSVIALHNVSIHQMYDDWKNGTGNNILSETQITWNNQPCGVNLNNDTNCNLTTETYIYFNSTTAMWTNSLVNNSVSVAVNNNKESVSFFLTPNLLSGQTTFRSKNYGTPTSRPYLNITYSEVVDTCTCPAINTNWEINMADSCTINTACNLGTGKLSFTGSGSATCNAEINTSDLGDPGSGGTLNINSGCVIWVS